MDYFGGATAIGALCCLELLWAIDLVCMPLLRPTSCINCCIDVAYILEFYSKKLALVVDLAKPNIWGECLQECL